jgi:hypothetical protein
LQPLLFARYVRSVRLPGGLGRAVAWRVAHACVLIGAAACATGGPATLSAPAPADPDVLYFCVLGQLKALGYSVWRADRASCLIRARSDRPQATNTRYEPLYNEIAVAVSHDPGGDTMYVTATDRGHGKAIVAHCAGPR